MAGSALGSVAVAVTVLLTVYGQLAFRWQVRRAGELPEALGDRAAYLAQLLLSPVIISAFVAGFIAALAWMIALNRFELSRVYPFMSLSFVLVLLASAVLFAETVTLAKVAGILLIVAGLIVSTR